MSVAAPAAAARTSAALSPAQERSIYEAITCAERILLWHGSVRSGKTLSSLLSFLEFVRTGPAGPLIVVGRTIDTLGRNVFDPLKEWFGPLADLAVQYTRGANTARILGRLVYCVGASDARAEGRIRGLTLAGAYVDEGTLIPEAFFRMLLTRLSVDGAKLFVTTNPDSPRHWLKTDFLDRARQLSLRAWHFTLRDNPALSPTYRAALDAEFTGLWHDRFVKGLWVSAEGVVYQAWDETRHVTDRIPKLTRLHWIGMDDGTVNAFVALLLALGVDQRLYFLDELRWDSAVEQQRITDLEKVEQLHVWHSTWPARVLGQPAGTIPPDPQWTGVDPAAASLKAQLHRSGFPSVTNAPNGILSGVRAIDSLLALDRLRVHPRCTGWRDEIPGYVWDVKAAEQGEDKPLQQRNHSLDAGRYAVGVARSVWAPWLTTHQQQEAAA